MIHTNRTVTVGNQESIIDSPIILYRGDRDVEVEFTLNGNKFMFTNSGNVIKSANATLGQLVINTPSGENMFSAVSECHEGKVVFIITKEMIDELIEVGFYSFQIRLFDDTQASRVTIPPIYQGIEIRNPIAAEDETSVVDMGLVDLAIVKASVFEDLSTFLPNGNYNKTDWQSRDVISQARLNKIEDAVYQINENMEATDLSLLNRLDSINQNVNRQITDFTKQANADIEDFERSINNQVGQFKVDVNSAMTAHKNEVSEVVDAFANTLKEVAINVKDFGAKCDGITDDTEAINNAITYAIENQSVRTIIINGDCAVDSIIFSCNNKIIEGNGKIIANKNIQEFIQISGNGNIFRGFDVCSPNGITANYFIRVTGDDNIIEKCKVYRQTKIQADGMLWSTRNISITGNRNTLQNCESFNGPGGVGVGGKYNKILHCYIHDNVVGINCGAQTRDCEIGHNRIINNNVVYDSGTDGILCTRNTSRMNIHHNTIHGNSEHGIYFQGDNSIICDNDVSFNAHSGIKLASYNDGLYFYEDETQPEYYVGHGNIVSNNQCNNNTEGIYLQASLSDIVVSDNICARNVEEGIRTAYTSDTYTIESLTIDNNRLYDNGSGMSITCDSDLKVTNNIDKASSTTIGGPSDEYSTHVKISGNHFYGRLIVSRTDNGRVVNNRIDKLTVVSNNLGVYLIDNIVYNQDIDLSIDRVREMRGCAINFVDASLIATVSSLYLKRINDCTLSFNGKSADYDYSIQLSKEYTQFDFSNNKITQSAESWRIANIKAVDSLILNNSIYCTNNTEAAFILDISGSICNNNIIVNSARGISIRGNNNIVCCNRAADVYASGTYTGNILDNNLTV